MTDKEVMQQALEALECMIDDLMYKDHKRVIDISNVAITALKAALEQQAEPPPEWPLIKNILAEYGLGAISFVAEFKAAQRPWVDLTDEDWEWVADKKETSLDTFAHGAAWAADQLKEKNT